MALGAGFAYFRSVDPGDTASSPWAEPSIGGVFARPDPSVGDRRGAGGDRPARGFDRGPAASPTATATPGTEPSPTVTPTPTPTRTPDPSTPARSDPPSSEPAPRPDPSEPESPPTKDRRTLAEEEVIRLTNAERSEKGCGPLRYDERLRDASRKHSVDMDGRDYFSHTSPDGRSPWDRAEAEGYTSPGGENIARGYTTPEKVVQAWMDSDGHRANILNCDFTAIGVGVHFADGGPWWTQMFGYE